MQGGEIGKVVYSIFDNVLTFLSYTDAANTPTANSATPFMESVVYSSMNGYDCFVQPSAAETRARQCKAYGSGSFVVVNRIVQDDVSACGVWSVQETQQEMAYASRPGKPDGPAIGEATVPIGDVLFPMLLCAAMFVVVRSLRVRRTLRKIKI